MEGATEGTAPDEPERLATADQVMLLVVTRLGEGVVDLHAEALEIPRWRPCPYRWGRVVGGLYALSTLYEAFRDSSTPAA